jgi:integrase
MTRRGRGEGSVYWDADRGRYVGAVSFSDPDSGRRIRRKVSGRTKAEVRDKLDALQSEKRTTGTVARRDTTIGQVVEDFLANLPPEIRSRSPCGATRTSVSGSSRRWARSRW